MRKLLNLLFIFISLNVFSQGITLNPAALPNNAEVGKTYNNTLSATGGMPPYLFSVSSGSLPSGLYLRNNTGAIIGVPSTASSYVFTVTATDMMGTTGMQTYSLDVNSGGGCSPITINPPNLPNGTVGAFYNQSFTASGGTGMYNFLLASGDLPFGLSLNSTGTITGIPSQAGIFSFIVIATDFNNCGSPASYQVTIVVGAPPLMISTIGLPNAIMGVSYSQNISVSGGTAPYSFSVMPGSLPPGLSLNTSTGEISGIPTMANLNPAPFIITVSDAAGSMGSQGFTIVVLSSSGISLNPATLPSGAVGQMYSQVISAVGGMPVFSFSISSGSLPPGLSLVSNFANAVFVAGVPQAQGTYIFTVNVSDMMNNSGSQSYTVTITAPIQGGTITLAPMALATGTAGLPYYQVVSASGGMAPYNYTITGAPLPMGLTFDGITGTISGTPMMPSLAPPTFTITATDMMGNTGSQVYSITIFQSTGPAVITLSPLSLPAGTVGIPYMQTLSGSGGMPPYSFSVSSGILAPGLQLNQSSGSISGTPMQSGSFAFTVMATDMMGNMGTQAYNLSISNIVNPDIIIIPTMLPNGTVGESYNQFLSASGGMPPYSFSVINGSLPTGITLGVTGIINGAPTASGTSMFTVQVTDMMGTTGTQAYMLTISAAVGLVVNPLGLPFGFVGQAYDQAIVASGGMPPYTYAVTSGTLPPGLSLNSSTGVVSGIPTSVVLAPPPFVITATDMMGNTGFRFYSLSIFDAPAPALTGITITSSAPLTFAPGGTAQLTASPVPVGADLGTVIWTSSDVTKATVSSTGLVTGIAEGSVLIRATSGSVFSEVTINVSSPGSSCETAVDLGSSDIIQNNISMAGNEIWFKFIPNVQRVRIEVNSVGNSTDLQTISVFQGDCGNLSLFTLSTGNGNGVSLTADSAGLIAGNTYFIKVSSVVGQVINLGLENISVLNTPFTIFFDKTLCGLDYQQVSLPMNKRNSCHVKCNGSCSVICPGSGCTPCTPGTAVFNFNSIPAGAQLVNAYLLFTTVQSTNHATAFNIDFNVASQSTSLPVKLTGHDNSSTCWQIHNASLNVTDSYTVDVTSVLQPLSNLNNSYSASGFPPAQADVDPAHATFDITGATLLIIYTTCPIQNPHPSRLVMWTGLQDLAGNTSFTSFAIPAPATPANSNIRNAKGFMIFSDVENSATKFIINSNPALSVAPVVPPHMYHFAQENLANLGSAGPQSTIGFNATSDGADCYAISFLGLSYTDITTNCAPVTPVITGIPNTCGSHIYSVINPDHNITYTWHVTGGTPATFTGPSVDVTWNFFNQNPPVGTIYVTTTNANVNDCPAKSNTIYVYTCCTGDANSLNFKNTSITEAFLALHSGHLGFFLNGSTYLIKDNGGSGGEMSINGIFIVDADLTIQNSNIVMGPEAKIIVRPGKTLTLQYTGISYPTALYARCGIMWDGIYLDDRTAHLIVTSTNKQNLVIQDARNAVVSNNGGDFRIDHTTFQLNNKDIVVNGYQGNHSGTINSDIFATFTKSIGVAGTSMRPYFTGNVLNPALPRTNIGVEIAQVTTIKIGDDSKGTNLFDNMDYGISSSLSNLTVFNNVFQNMTNTTPFPLNGIAVFSSGGRALPPLVPGSIRVGGNLNNQQKNTFTNCSVGVLAQNLVRAVIVDQNDFTNNISSINNIENIGVSNCVNSNITITNNKSTCKSGAVLQFGVNCTDISGSIALIRNNSILSSVNNNLVTTGINIGNASLGNVALNIDNNTITSRRNGIFLTGVNGGTLIMNSTALIENNTVNINQPTTSNLYYGIRVENCSNVKVGDGNKVSGTGITITTANGPAYQQILRGVSVTNSPMTTVSKNILKNLGSGIFCKGIDNNSLLACNKLQGCFNGVFFIGGTAIGNQLPSSAFPANTPTANQWIGNIGPNKMAASSAIIAATWNWNGGGNFNANPSSVPLLLINGPTGVSDACPSFSPAPPPPNTAELRQDMFADIINDQQVFSDYQMERAYMSKQYAYRYIKAVPELLNLGVADDSVYQNFFKRNQNGSLGALEQVQDLILQQDSIGAFSLNNSIEPTNLIESNKQTVNAIYINSWMKGLVSFSSTDSSILNVIAFQNPLTGGEGVYSARVMLGLDLDDDENHSSRISYTTRNEETKNNFSKIYPNPNDGTMQLDYQLEEHETAQILIFNILGTQVGSYTIAGNKSGTFKISEITLKNGVYFYEIKINNKLICSDKIVILK